jgi:hypothetical protein
MIFLVIYNFFFIPHAGKYEKAYLDPYKGYDMNLSQKMVFVLPSAFEIS